ncbi:MAG: succinate dehydrogenase iron-sulfur subunit [Phycisphaerae bacterium]|nr:succinate dehydrogenase iron-sulfur subunit [Phycisphaerae bacterium]NIW95348.1 succinate dehydrogenase iron-sulfur subunit [Phycisphaerae bacterium]
MNIILRILRYNPQTDNASQFQDFSVTVEPTDRILDVLMFIKRNIDGTLSFRKSCAHGVCGSDSMIINGVERLACKTLVQDVAGEENAVVVIEPLKSMPVQRDLMVDYRKFFEAYRQVKPFLIPARQAERAENIQTPAERSRFEDPTKCILCASCHSACPVVADKNVDFIGPAAAAQAARFVFDSRDEGLKPRLDVLDKSNGLWACKSHFECTRVCPRGIKVTKNINLTKREIKRFKEKTNKDT